MSDRQLRKMTRELEKTNQLTKELAAETLKIALFNFVFNIPNQIGENHEKKD